MKRTIAAMLLVGLALGSGCLSTSTSEPHWQRAELAAPSENILWSVAGQEVQRVGFPVGSDADPTAMVMRSGWRTALAPFRGEGHRERLELRIDSIEDGRWALEVRVESQRNMDLARPMDPGNAQWEPAADDLETAQIVIQRIRARLGERLETAPQSGRAGR